MGFFLLAWAILDITVVAILLDSPERVGDRGRENRN
jgi:hypothetical protein